MESRLSPLTGKMDHIHTHGQFLAVPLYLLNFQGFSVLGTCVKLRNMVYM